MSDTETKNPILELKTKEWVDWGITSFAQFDASKAAREQAEHVMDLSNTFMNLMYNITYSSEITDKSAAMLELINEFTKRLNGSESEGEDDMGLKKKEGRKKFGRSDYLINSSDNPDDWQYLVVKESGKLDLEATNLAVDLLQKELLPDMCGQDLISVRARVKSIYNALGVVAEQQPAFVNELPSLFLWKEKSSEQPLHFMMIYSNNAMDRDAEPNLFKERSHKVFAELANSGVLPMPEAWVWHTPGSRWGQVNHIMILEGDDGFVLPVAFGTVDAGMEEVAENLFKERDLLVSHGSPKSMVIYDDEDKRLIDFAPTLEISPLPKKRAANELTAFIY